MPPPSPPPTPINISTLHKYKDPAAAANKNHANCLFSSEEEAVLVEHCQLLGRLNMPLDDLNLRLVAQACLVTLRADPGVFPNCLPIHALH